MSGNTVDGSVGDEQDDRTRELSPTGTKHEEDEDPLKEVSVFFTMLFGLAGATAGVFWILFDAIEPELFDVETGVTGSFPSAIEGLALFSAMIIMLVPAKLGIGLAPFVGAIVGPRVDRHGESAYKAVGMACFLGTVVSFLLFTVLYSTGFGDDISVDFGGAIVVAFLAGLMAALAGVGGAWVSMNRTPTLLATDRQGDQ